MKIVKADGAIEEFKPQKLIGSLKKAGASPHEVDLIVRTVQESLRDGMQTQKIYERAFELLRESNNTTAARYSLRRAVFGLGPSGFPFEDYLGRIFEAEGYKTKRRLILRGKCATHEVDLACYSPSDSFVAEAKFHMRPGIKSDLQVAMYSYARYLDLESARICKQDVCGIISLKVITNTKFTEAAIKYAKCVGIDLLSWDYPRGNSLHERIERTRLYPITVLTKLAVSQKARLLALGVITLTDITNKTEMLRSVGVQEYKIKQILDEIQSVLTNPRKKV